MEPTAHWITGKVTDDGLVPYAVIDLHAERAVGLVSHMAIERAMGTVEIGHVTRSRAMKIRRSGPRRHGCCCKMVLFHGYRRLEWKCDSMNPPPAAPPIGWGLPGEGRLRQRMVLKGRTRDSDMLSIIDREWPRAMRRCGRGWRRRTLMLVDGNKAAGRFSLNSGRAPMSRPNKRSAIRENRGQAG